MFPGRTDATEMAKICTLTTGLDTSLSIDIANELITDVLEPLLKDDGETPYYTTHYLTLLETLAACHFYCLNDPRGARERVGPITFEGQSRVDIGFKVTHYGQQLLALDRSGELAALQKQMETGKPAKFKARMFWTGKDYSQWGNWPATVGERYSGFRVM